MKAGRNNKRTIKPSDAVRCALRELSGRNQATSKKNAGGVFFRVDENHPLCHQKPVGYHATPQQIKEKRFVKC